MLSKCHVTSNKQLNSSSLCNLLLIKLTLSLQVLGIPIQDVCIRRININVLEKVVPHVGVITFRVAAR